MQNNTRKAYDLYTARLASLNGVGDASKTFAVEPSVQQTLETKIQESSGFLSKINIIGVTEQEGEKLGLGISGPIAGRTNTNIKDRQTRDLSTLDANRYRCEKTNFDTHLGYAKLDAWAKFQDFQERVRNVIVQQQALDRIMIGWNGTSVATETNIADNPLLQDVNKGWLQQLRETAEERVMTEGGKEEGKIIIGADGDYKNLDALVYDMITLLDPWHQDSTDVVAILGRKLMHDKYFPLVNNNGDKPTETLAGNVIISQKRVGGLQAVTVPFFPENGILITPLKNLSIYWQEGARRRRVIENPKRDRIENYESSNDAYVIEDLGAAGLAENIELAA